MKTSNRVRRLAAMMGMQLDDLIASVATLPPEKQRGFWRRTISQIEDWFEARGGLGADAFRAMPAAIHYKINDRADWQRQIERAREGDEIGVVISGMDCDCTAYHRERVIPVPGLVEWQRREARRREWLDGPESLQLVRPSEIDPDAGYSRDLAMEAFENGHAHSVSW